MNRHRLVSVVPLLAAILLFLSGVAEFFVLRFQAGDVYPIYSSYRSDPLGTMAFYESLGLLPGVTSFRNTEPLGRVPGMDDAALFLIGLEKGTFRATDWPSVEAIEKAAQAGARIVITFAPEQGESSKGAPSPSGGENGKKGSAQVEKGRKKEDGAGQEPGLLRGFVDLRDRWHLDIQVLPEQHGPALLSESGAELPSAIDWHSAMVFEPIGGVWRTIYTRDGKAVVVEQKMGKGEIVLASDSFLLSNEAMKDYRIPNLLAWLCGGHRRIIFDETHLGLSKNPGIAAILRRHGFTPFFVSLIVLTVLAIWKQSASFVPPLDQDEREAADPGRTYAEGMTNLLRRNILPGDLLAACLDEWERSFTRGAGSLASLTPEIKRIIAADRIRPKRNRKPAEAYSRISALVMARRRGERK